MRKCNRIMCTLKQTIFNKLHRFHALFEQLSGLIAHSDTENAREFSSIFFDRDTNYAIYIRYHLEIFHQFIYQLVTYLLCCNLTFFWWVHTILMNFDKISKKTCQIVGCFSPKLTKITITENFEPLLTLWWHKLCNNTNYHQNSSKNLWLRQVCMPSMFALSNND